MAETSLHAMAMEKGWTELAREVEQMDTARLFAELDDTVQIDMMNVSSEEWALIRSKKAVYTAICRELMKRCK